MLINFQLGPKQYIFKKKMFLFENMSSENVGHFGHASAYTGVIICDPMGGTRVLMQL